MQRGEIADNHGSLIRMSPTLDLPLPLNGSRQDR